MSRRAFAFAAAVLLACTVCCAATGNKPNVVVIVADDLGYGDVGVHGCTDIPTPHIDSLARDVQEQ